MNDNPNEPDQNEKDAGIAFLWLMVGLAPAVIYLVVFAPHGPRPKWLNPIVVFIFCTLCNLLGGLGCVRNIKDADARIMVGLFLAICFFVLSWIIAVYQACSHMQI